MVNVLADFNRVQKRPDLNKDNDDGQFKDSGGTNASAMPSLFSRLLELPSIIVFIWSLFLLITAKYSVKKLLHA